MSRVDQSSTLESFEDLPCGLVAMTLDGVIVRANEAFASLVGRSSEELLGTRFAALLGPGGQLFFESRFASVLLVRGEVEAVAVDVQPALGEPVPVLVNGVVARDAAGEPSGIRMAVFEYGERRDYERQLLSARRAAEASEARLRVLHSTSERLSAAESEDHLAAELADCAREAFSAPEVCVLLGDEAGTLCLSSGDAGLAASLLAGDGVVERALAEQQVVTLTDSDAAALASSDVADAMRAARLETLVVVPVAEPQRRLGALVLGFRRARRFESEDADLAMTVTRQAAEVLGRMRAERILERLALYDETTGLATRRLVIARTNEVVDEALASGRSMAAAVVAVDGYRAISDSFGRGAIDDAITELGERLSASVPEGGLVGRFGSADFAVILPDTDASALVSLTDEFIAALAAPLRTGDGSASVSSTIGAVVLSGASVRPSAQTLFERASDALYRARALGTNRAEVTTLE